MQFEEILQKHSFEVSGLLRRHKIAGELNAGTIKKAYDQKGTPFMMDLLKIVTPTSSFLGIGEGRGFLGLGKQTTTAGAYDPYADPLSDESWAAAGQQAQPAAAVGSSWGWWDKLLNTVSKTGETVAKVKSDVSGTTAADNQAVYMATQQTAQSNNLIYMAAGALVLIIIIILLFKK